MAFHGIAIPQSGLLSQASSLRLPSGHSGLVLTLSDAACASLSSPRLLVADAGIWAASLLGVAVKHVISGFIYLFIFPPGYVASEIPRLTTDLPERMFPGVWKLLFSLRLPSRDGSLSLSLLSLFLSFIFCPTSFQRQWAAFLGA